MAAEGPAQRKRVLALSYAFAPLSSPSAVMATRIVRYLPRYGWDVTVLTVDPATTLDPIDPGLARLIGAEARVERTPARDSRALVGVLRRIAPSVLTMPDTKFPWIMTAVRAARRLLARERFDLLYSHGTYFTSHLVGRWIVEGAGLPWAVYFTDPWSDNPFHAEQSAATKVNRWLERRVVERADLCLFTNERTRDLVMAKYDAATRARTACIPQGYDRSDLPPAEPRAPGEPLTLVHTGNFYGLRSPRPLFEALGIVARRQPLQGRLRVRLIGGIQPEHVAELRAQSFRDIVQVEPPVPYHESLRLMANADVLLAIDAPGAAGAVFLPSKLVDYLSTGKLILGVTMPDGVSADYLRATGNVCVDVNDPQAIAAAIEQITASARREPEPVAGAAEILAGLDVRETTRRVAACFDQLVGRDARVEGRGKSAG